MLFCWLQLPSSEKHKLEFEASSFLHVHLENVAYLHYLKPASLHIHNFPHVSDLCDHFPIIQQIQIA